MKCGELYVLYKRAIESNLAVAAARLDLKNALETRKLAEAARLKVLLGEAEFKSKLDLEAVIEHLKYHECQPGTGPGAPTIAVPVSDSFVTSSNLI
jgi:hypothetical protein